MTRRPLSASISPISAHTLARVIAMLGEMLLFFLKDALFLLGVLARGNAFPKPLAREEEAELLERMAAGDAGAREKLIEHNFTK